MRIWLIPHLDNIIETQTVFFVFGKRFQIQIHKLATADQQIYVYGAFIGTTFLCHNGLPTVHLIPFNKSPNEFSNQNYVISAYPIAYIIV